MAASTVQFPEAAFFGTFQFTIGEFLVIGNGPRGNRVVSPHLNGTVVGPKLNGELVGPAGDWSLTDATGTLTIDARNHVRTPEGDLIYVQFSGLAPGTTSPPEKFYTRVFFETGSEKYYWLNQIFTVAHGRRIENTLSLDVFQLDWN